MVDPVLLLMKQDPPVDVGDEPLDENQILRKKIILIQLHKGFNTRTEAIKKVSKSLPLTVWLLVIKINNPSSENSRHEMFGDLNFSWVFRPSLSNQSGRQLVGSWSCGSHKLWGLHHEGAINCLDFSSDWPSNLHYKSNFQNLRSTRPEPSASASWRAPSKTKRNPFLLLKKKKRTTKKEEFLACSKSSIHIQIPKWGESLNPED